MSDSYLKFANSKFGAKLTHMLGLPQPLPLQRYSEGQPAIEGAVLLGGQLSELSNAVISQLQAMQATTLRTDQVVGAAEIPQWRVGDAVKALIFDASGMTSSEASFEIYRFFNQAIKSLQAHGRVIVLGRTPESCESAKQAALQRALEGLTRSLAKELRKAITVQLIYVSQGAEANLESSLRFFLSPRSAYISGQVIRITAQTKVSSSGFSWAQPLTGKKVLVTGASQGIGLAVAEAFAREGAHAICLDIPAAQTALQNVAQRLGGSELALDLRSEQAAETLTAAALKDGGWDVVVHNAGITQDKTLAKMSETQWSTVVDINLSAQERINDALLAAGAIKKNGRIIAVSSISGIAGNRGQTNYALSKAGVIGMVQASAPIVAKHDVTINAVAPGFIETKMTAAIPFGVREAGRRLNSLSQGGLPIDVAEAIVFFAHPASSGLNGNVLRVCGQSLLGA